MEDNENKDKEYIEQWEVTQNDGKETLTKKKRKRSIKKYSNASEGDKNLTQEEEKLVVVNDAFNLTEEEKRRCMVSIYFN